LIVPIAPDSIENDPTRQGGPGPDFPATPPAPLNKATPEQPIPGQLKANNPRSLINIREGPGTDYAVLFSAHPQDIVKITNETVGADGYTWYQIDHEGFGWVHESLLNLEEGVATVTANYADSIINVRSGPGKTYQVIHWAYVGDRFPVLEQSGDRNNDAWYLLDLNYSGWVRSDLIHKGTALFD
jgi:SH3-like domain-containing protein